MGGCMDEWMDACMYTWMGEWVDIMEACMDI